MMPIPHPKQFTLHDGVIPVGTAVQTEEAAFLPAARVFERYAKTAFGAADGTPVTAVLQPDIDGYRISITDTVTVTAADSVGINHAFATLLQLAQETDGGMVFPRCEIEDRADNEWRGLMLDLSRCFHEVPYLFAVADLCWYYKISRLQLHFTDDQGIRFPFDSVAAAVADEHYSKDDLRRLADYCHERGVVIVPEIDAPGHARPFNAALPQLFGTAPESGSETSASIAAVSGIMRADEVTFETLEHMLAEVAALFPHSPYIHIGGDEAEIGAWDRCPVSVAYRKQHKLTDVHELYGHYVARLSNIVLGLGRIPVVWEGFSENCNPMIPKETLVMAWESLYQTAPQLLAGGFTIINVSWQPLYIVPFRRYWEPTEILAWDKTVWKNWWERSLAFKAPITVPDDAPVLGGQMCVWGDGMADAADPADRHDRIREEFALLRKRLPALAQKSWTSFATPDSEAFLAAAEQLDRRLETLL